MSHFTRLKTQMVVKEHLLQALTALGYTYEEGELSVKGFAGARSPVEIKVKTRFAGFEFGFRKQGQTYELVADWWGVKALRPEPFRQQLTQQYAFQAARHQLEAQGFALVNEEKQADGRIHLVLRRTQ
jgi:hypothetical protein